MFFYHGTTTENIRSIVSKGLAKGTHITPDYATAVYFALKRSHWNSIPPIIFQIETQHHTEIKSDAVGHLESELLAIVSDLVIMPELGDVWHERRNLCGWS